MADSLHKGVPADKRACGDVRSARDQRPLLRV